MKREEQTHPVTELIGEIIRGICLVPEKVRVTEVFSEKKLRIELRASIDDHRIIVGRNGSRIQALQVIAQRAGEGFGVQASVQLLPPLSGRPSPNSNVFTPDERFDEKALLRFVGDVCEKTNCGVISSVSRDESKSLTTITITGHKKTDDIVIHSMHEIFFSYGFKIGRRIKIESR